MPVFDGPCLHPVTTMTVWQIDPVRDPRWSAFLERHPRATVFHTPGWLEALRRTYGYDPLALTTTAPSEDLSNGLVFCRVKSWLTGCRMVSLPFSDHCQPLVETEEESESLFSALKRGLDTCKAKYFEIRPITPLGEASLSLVRAGSFYLHQMDLRPDLEKIFRSFHKNCIQRKIWRAQREALSYEEGRTESLLTLFYSLLALTRRRKGLLPQPLDWFRNLTACMGERLKIRVAFKDGHPVAGILTLCYKDTLVYKYGCSDRRFNRLGGMHFLFWKAIQDAKNQGLSKFDLGRSDWDDHGLISFKDRWGADRSVLVYWRYGAGSVQRVNSHWQIPIARRIIGHMPNGFLRLAGRLAYRHYA